MNRKQLAVKGLIKMISGILAMGLCLFLPAQTFHFPGAWRMILILFVPMFILGIVLIITSPKLMEKRLNSKETETSQKKVILFSFIIFISCFVLSGLDFRYGWTQVPVWLVLIACIVFILTYTGFIVLLKQNEYLSRIVEVQENQHVIDIGMYGIVHHPMYSIILFMFISMPLIIGSFMGLIPLIVLPIILVMLIKNEEEVLEKGLIGYSEYKKKVRYRMIPFIW